MTNTTSYGQQVRTARNLKDYSQEALAIAAGLSKRTIQNVEAGGNPGAETKRELAAVLGEALNAADRLPSTSLDLECAGGDPQRPFPTATCSVTPAMVYHGEPKHSWTRVIVHSPSDPSDIVPHAPG